MDAYNSKEIVFHDDFIAAPANVITAYNRIKQHDACYFDLNDHRRRGRVVKWNPKTVWVSIVFGVNTRKVIKRHIEKHHVNFI